ncbi:MAG: hypothetical protein LBL79_08500 [Prevotella sp.]|nr:hypothetical protein [Prevotella sp.]
MKTTEYPYRIGRFRFITKMHISITVVCPVMVITSLAGAFFNPARTLFCFGFTALNNRFLL